MKEINVVLFSTIGNSTTIYYIDKLNIGTCIDLRGFHPHEK